MFAFSDLNYLAILIAFAFTFILGSFWYGPLFGKPWLAYVKAMHKKFPTGGSMLPLMVLAAINTLMASLAMAIFVELLNATVWLDAVVIAIWGTIGFASFPLMSGVIWERRPFGFYLINVGYCFVSFLGMAIILTVM